ncbi:unnamed protein product [Paramecium sonneborni]|uniref:Uncharacterized protein n=1 Tax=Paramecium sonneborni TaxID=65129 RepID=A0A8S1KHT7_9CILI|nr:unnamed protein product [Paramecium sonneborni]
MRQNSESQNRKGINRRGRDFRGKNKNFRNSSGNDQRDNNQQRNFQNNKFRIQSNSNQNQSSDRQRGQNKNSKNQTQRGRGNQQEFKQTVTQRRRRLGFKQKNQNIIKQIFTKGEKRIVKDQLRQVEERIKQILRLQKRSKEKIKWNKTQLNIGSKDTKILNLFSQFASQSNLKLKKFQINFVQSFLLLLQTSSSLAIINKQIQKNKIEQKNQNNQLLNSVLHFS